jgi:tetratricopeptide (TPR) repeat protein
MPLGLELAASWTDMLPLKELAAEIQQSLDILETDLRNIPDRQRSIRAVFDTTWQRLQPAEQEICAQLSLFRGGFTRQAAQQIAIARDGRQASLQMLSRLADKSLIQYNRENRRYQVHELLRQYAGEQLEQMPDIKTAVEERFHNYFAAFLYGRREAITAHSQGNILRQITAELDNIRPVWRQSLNPPNLSIIKQTYYTLYQFGDFQGHFRENTGRIEQTIAALKTLPQTAERDELLAVLYTQLGYAYIRTGPLSEVEPACRKSLSLYESLGMTPPPAFGTDPHTCLGLLANISGRFSEAQQLAEEAVTLHDQPGQELNLTIAYYVLNEALAAQGSYEKAFEYAQKAYRLTEQIGNRWMMATILIQLGNISRALGQLDQARSYYQSSYDIKDAFNDPEGMAAALNNLGNIASLQADYQEAENYFQRGLGVYRNINDKGGVAISLNGLGETAVALADYSAARRYFREGLVIAADIQFTTRLLSLLTGVARLYLETENGRGAAQLLALVRSHPATDRQMGDLVEGLYKAYEGELGDEDVATGELMEVVEVVVSELGRG